MVESESQIIDFERLCRLCLHEQRILMEIFESSEENSNQLSIHEKIKAFSAIDVCEGDGLPSRICVPCLSSLNAAFDFKVQCENADKTLHNIYDMLVSDQLRQDKSVDDLEEQDVEETNNLKPKQVKYVDLSQVIVIEKDEVSEENEEYYSNREEQEETEDLLYMNYNIKKSKELSDDDDDNDGDDVIKVELNNVKDESTLLGDTKEALPLHTVEIKKSNCVSLQVEGQSVQEALVPREGINVHSMEEKSKRTEPMGEAKKSACPFCHKMLTRVKEHIRLLHRNKVYICKKHNCGAEFLTLKNLQSHQLKCYNMEKQYKCLKCFKEFYRKCNYKAHIIRHSNKKDFQCQLCDKAFVDSTGLRRHFLKHHELQQEIYISGCCNKKFKTKEGLKQHIQKGICGVQIFQVVESVPENT